MAVVVFYFCIKRYEGIYAAWNVLKAAFQPVIFGAAMAYLTNPMMELCEKNLLSFLLAPERRWKPKNEQKLRSFVRAVSSILAMLVLLAIVWAFMSIVVPRFVSTLNELVNNIHEKVVNVLDWVDDATGHRFEAELMAAKNSRNIDNAINQGVAFVRKYFNIVQQDQLVRTFAQLGINVGRVIVNLVIGFFVSVYALMIKETLKGQMKKLTYGVFPPKAANVMLEVMRKANEIFYAFIVGKIIDSTVIGIICYISMIIMGMPYGLLCSVIIGVTNVIPIFGPYIGAVPTVLLIFVTNPMQGIYFLIFVLILQQVDGNIIGPRILGNSTGVSSFWVVVAIVVGGSLFGVFGMLFGVPTIAVLGYVGGRIVNFLVRRRGLPENTEDYIELGYVDPVSGVPVQKRKEKPEAKQGRLPKFGFLKNLGKRKPQKKD